MTADASIRPADISVVIPALNEENTLGTAIRSARRAGAVDVTVSDGGSLDGTIAAARDAGATRVVRSLPGRGIQLNAGAVHARGAVILFLHADSELGVDCLEQIAGASRSHHDPSTLWGAFRQRIDSGRAVYRWIERGNALRVLVRRRPFGDQAIFVRNDLFRRVGGFPEIPLMEDVELSRRLAKVSSPILLAGPVKTSARRWESRGVIRQTARNWSIQVAHAVGVSPATLTRWYR